jgi:hypothetical protein
MHIVPTSPPSNIELDANVSTSLEHLTSSNGNHHNSVVYRNQGFNNHNNNNSHKNQLNKLIETSNQQDEFTQFPSQYMRSVYHASEDTTSNHSKPLNQSNGNKNVKIASCMDKWYKELKGQVLVSVHSIFNNALLSFNALTCSLF